MTLELQIRESVISHAIVQWVQTRLFTLCVPTPLPVIVDHLDTVGAVGFTVRDDGAVAASLAARIFVVLEPDLLVNPGHPASQPATADLTVTIGLGIRDRALVIVDATAEPSDNLPDVVRDAVVPLLNDLLDPLEGQQLFDVAPIITALEAAIPSAEPDLALADGVLALRFGADGPFTPQLSASHDWGVVLDVEQALGLLRRRIPDRVPVTMQWRPDGATPTIDAGLSFNAEVIGLEIAGITAVVTARPTFVEPATLRLAASWGLDLTGIASIAEPAVRRFVRGEVRRIFADATHDGAQSLYYDIPLPVLPDILGSLPTWGGIDSSPAGMTLGGPVRPVKLAPRELLTTSVYRFGRPIWWGRCRERAQAGSGNPPRSFAATDAGVRVQAGVTFFDAGALCGVTLYPPSGDLASRLSADATGAGFDLTVGQGRRITSDVRMLVRTARGARVINLGRPSIRENGDGTLDVQVNFINDCLHLSGVWLKLALGEAVNPEDFRPGPVDEEDWITVLGARRGFNSHIVTLGGLDAGEAVTVTAHGLRVTVFADEAGQAVVPAFVAIGETLHDVTLARASHLPLPAEMSVETTEFHWLADVGEADAAATRAIDGAVLIARDLAGEALLDEWQPDGETMLLRRDGGEVELNPQPLPPEPPEAARLAAAAGLDDVVSAQVVPGFDARLAIVQTQEGRGVIVAPGSRANVVGEWEGPLIGVHVEGGYALARSGGAVQLFSVRRPGRVTFRDRMPVTG
ncbi:hypothetical protein HDC37_000328 [Microbacterium sp. AK009]|uniref:hypothetical protein n=1 Tax=Microbacterium sp. AK009 TaxID=2723068 RepID=UPI0015C94B00|nr:hypothetical protein [Microbacterium sp. AK009]NYF15516.1 hypothetical protein [Microbacterium sp. AK009]